MSINSAPITSQQWEKWEETVSTYPQPEWTEEEKTFVTTFMTNERNQRQWIMVFRDHLTLAADMVSQPELAAYELHSVEDRCEKLKAWAKIGLTSFKDVVGQFPSEEEDSYAVLQRVRESISLDKLPFRVLVTLLATLCFRYMPRSNSWEFAGKSYLLMRFTCNLLVDLYNIEPEIEPEEMDRAPDVLEEVGTTATVDGVLPVVPAVVPAVTEWKAGSQHGYEINYLICKLSS